MTYNSVGHCFFLEDGIEHGNEFVHNLGDPDKVPYVQALHRDQPRRSRRGPGLQEALTSNPRKS